MKTKMRFLCFLLMMTSFIIHAQTNAKTEIRWVIDQFFEGLHKGDTAMIKETIATDIKMQTAIINKEGISILRDEEISQFLKAVASKPEDAIWKEELLSYSIAFDGNIASVWTPYKFYFNEEFSHCGSNSFQLFYDNATWKIIYLLDTRKKTDCKN